MSCKCKNIMNVLEGIAPASLAEEWDNTGLIVGDPENDISRVLVTLDVDLDVVREAIGRKAQMIVSHHPVLFHSVKKLDFSDPEMQVIRELVRNDICLYAAHTNLDAAKGGVNDCLAHALGLKDISVLRKTRHDALMKLVVYVPADHMQTVIDALFAHGAGQTGAYSRCSFISEGTGTFLPEEGTHPYTGKTGDWTHVREARVETIIPASRADEAVAAMREKHPYEEPAYDLFPIQGSNPFEGMGRIGRLEPCMGLRDFCTLVKSRLDAGHVVTFSNDNSTVKTVAVCGGSGADLIGAAAERGADVLVTGDMKHHDWLHAKALGINVVDAGHYYTERVVVRPLIEHLHRSLNTLEYTVEIVESNIDTGSTYIY